MNYKEDHEQQKFSSKGAEKRTITKTAKHITKENYKQKLNINTTSKWYIRFLHLKFNICQTLLYK